jgi:predicted HicB family RNase H-like nuclease
MTRKPIPLSDAMTKKTAAPEPIAAPAGGSVRTLTLRLPPVVHDQLREMAFTARKSQHALLMEALNDFFAKHGKPPLAS